FADFLSRGMTERATLGVRHFRPFGESCPRRRDCAIEISRSGNWREADNSAGRRIMNLKMLVCGGLFAIDDELVFIHRALPWSAPLLPGFRRHSAPALCARE